MNASRTPFVCASCAKALRYSNAPSQTLRAFTTSANLAAPGLSESSELPRWARTPPAMRMPRRLRPMPNQPRWEVNDKPEVLDEALDRFIGNAGQGVMGRDMLPEEAKWQSVTHKSFDHGRRPFNDKLAFLGKRILDLQASLALYNSSSSQARSSGDLPALEGVENMTKFTRNATIEKSRLARLAGNYGLDKVVRWKPRKSDNLESSGVDAVLAHTVCSIVGALALQKGGDVAVKVAKERILAPLGLRS